MVCYTPFNPSDIISYHQGASTDQFTHKVTKVHSELQMSHSKWCSQISVKDICIKRNEASYWITGIQIILRNLHQMHMTHTNWSVIHSLLVNMLSNLTRLKRILKIIFYIKQTFDTRFLSHSVTRSPRLV